MHHQQVLATTLNRLLFSQFSSFIGHFSHLTDGYPSRFAFFWNDDEVAKTFWAEMLDGYNFFLEAKKSSAAAMKKYTTRSFFNWVDVEEMFTFHDGTLTQNRVDNTFRMLCYMADSTPLENTSRLSNMSRRTLLAITAPPLHFGRLPSGRRR